MAEISDLDIVDASNTGRFPENQTFASINNAARALEGILARWYEDSDFSITSSGSSNAYAATSKRTISALTTNTVQAFTANHTNTGASTFALNGLTAKAIKRLNGDALTAGDITSGQPVVLVYKSSPDVWYLVSPYLAAVADASDTVKGIIELAIQSEMETATDVARAVVPGRQHFHPGHPKAGGNFNGSGTPAFASGDVGMGAITDNGTGDYTLNFDTAFNDTNFWMTGFTRSTAASGDGVLTAQSADGKTASTMRVRTVRLGSSGSTPIDSAEAGVTFWGDYA